MDEFTTISLAEYKRLVDIAVAAEIYLRGQTAETLQYLKNSVLVPVDFSD